MQQSHRIVGLITAAIGAAAFYGGTQLPPSPGQNIGPSLFPMVIGTGLMFCGVLIALGVGRSYEAEVKAEMAALEETFAEQEAGTQGRFHGYRAFIPPALMIFFAAALEPLGFVATAALVALALSRLLGATWWVAAATALISAPLIHLAFFKLLRVPLPAGLVPMPW